MEKDQETASPAPVRSIAPVSGPGSPPAVTPPRGPVLPVCAAIGVMVIWGGTPLFSKIAASQIDPVLVGVLRTVLAGCLALPLAVAMRLRLPSGKREKQLLAFSGFAAFIAFPLLFTVGQHRTSALHGALILATLPVFTSLFATVVERRQVSRGWIAGCLIALASEAVVIVLRQPGRPGSATLSGDLIVLGSSLICAMGYVAGARLAQSGYRSLATTIWGVLLASLLLGPLLIWSLCRSGVPQAGPAAWGSVLVLAGLTSVLGYVVWYWALAKGGISRIASVQFTQPLFGIILAGVVLGEWPAPVTALAGVGVLIGARLVLTAGSR